MDVVFPVQETIKHTGRSQKSSLSFCLVSSALRENKRVGLLFFNRV